MAKGLRLLLWAAVIGAAAYLCGYVVASRTWERKWDELPVDHQSDTVWVYDTTTVIKPVPKYVEVPGDTIRVPYAVAEHDTLYVPVPLETKTYEGDDYRAVVSGYRPSLDRIDVFRNTVYITNTETRTIPAPRWSLGITAGPQLGYGLTGDGRGMYAGFGITAGVQYRF